MSYNIQTKELRISTLFESSSRFVNNSTGTGSSVIGTKGLTLSTGTTNTSVAYVDYYVDGTLIPISSNNIRMSIFIRRSTKGTDFDFFAGMYDGIPTMVSAASINYTKNHIGFKCNRVSSGAETWSATVGNGTTESAVGISVVVGQTNIFTFVYNTSEIRFFVNGAYTCSITTNIPTISTLITSSGIFFTAMATNRATTSNTQFSLNALEILYSPF